jgi:hypothetical protein
VKEVFAVSEQKSIAGMVTGLVALLAAVCFFILGFITGSWHIVWVVFLAVPISAMIGELVTKRAGKLAVLPGLVAIVAAVVFLLLGLTLQIWHYAWLVFLAVPITSIIADAAYKHKDFKGAVVGIVAMLAVIAFFLMGFLLHIWQIAWVVFLAIPITAIIIDIIKAASGANKSGNMDGGEG